MGAVHGSHLDCTQILHDELAEQHESTTWTQVDGRHLQSEVTAQTDSSADARFMMGFLHTCKSTSDMEARAKIQAADDRQADMWPQQRSSDSFSPKKVGAPLLEWTDGSHSVSSANDVAETCQCTIYRMLAPATTSEARRRVAPRSGVEGITAINEPRDYRLIQGLGGQRCELRGIVGLTTIAECFQPLLLEVAGYLVTSPRDYVRCFLWVSPAVSMTLSPLSQTLWKQMYALKWSAFYDSLSFQGVNDWRDAFRNTLAGRVESTLEVFDREKKLGFAMAAMAAQVTFESKNNLFVARYLSASEVAPEYIPMSEAHRLRFCPPSARPKLQPGKYSKEQSAETVIYPYRVLQGLNSLVVGKGVELQWKMQYGSPFGWWYGHLEDLHHDVPSPGLATASITFPHFPRGSLWYRLQAIVGDDQMRVCSFGGYTGGLRGVTDVEHKRWMQFFPKEPVVF